ncbi:Arc family DNA-binding protein [Paenibacillus thermoaerophilus]|uniref:Arc family DNA-binding protein n=1 Tax=Paenibacillus thermoaerophilus TaxID=1215385 RepID=A0ABW2V394_9BACL|nr:Arc family DNA-binding protein [Paenibacillus thermoaerophilus]TMV17702.1 Arc family DNA-binding protein [Paenibacillus thermoaerophilus]
MASKKQFPLRLDPVLYEALERWAADEFRSVNSHIEYVLRDALMRAGRLPGRVARQDLPGDRPAEP